MGKLAIVLGIRPDVIRACLILNRVRAEPGHDVKFIWSGQHYSDNLKDIFFRELGVAPPDIELNARGDNDPEVSSSVLRGLYPVLEKMRPDAVVFLGDTNTVVGSLAAAALNIPIVHIEGCMRSYDWRMPEEKLRSTIDHLSDLIYTYFPEYKEQGRREGLNPNNIMLVGNPIVDVLNEYYYRRKATYDAMGDKAFFSSRGIERGEFYLMTCHRRENVHELASLKRILALVGATKRKVFFPASYRTQKELKAQGLTVPANVILVDPVGYKEMLVLMTTCRGVITDSGTVVEETCVLQVPSLQIRKATERPQVYDARSSVKFDPTQPEKYPFDKLYAKLESLVGKRWEHGLGDGKSSERIASDLISRLNSGKWAGHRPEQYHIDISRSYIEDGL